MRFYVLIKKITRAGKRKGFHINYEEFQNTKPRQYQKQVSSVWIGWKSLIIQYIFFWKYFEFWIGFGLENDLRKWSYQMKQNNKSIKVLFSINSSVQSILFIRII